MAIGLVSNLNTALGFGFPRAARFLQKSSNISSVATHTRIMATSSSIVGSGDIVVDALSPNCGSLCSFVKSGGVYFNNRSDKICSRGRLSLRNVAARSHRLFDFEQSSLRSFSSSCYSDHGGAQVSTDESLSGGQQIPTLALSDEQSPSDSTLKLVSGACYLPHPDKEKTGGEDAHFICSNEQVIGVADGVGGWADVGVNAGLYARELMSYSVEAVRKTPENVDPLSVLEKAHAKTTAMGSSTACIIALKNQELHAINLGDSGFIIVRDGVMIFESPVQQHGFNFTYQLERGTRGDLPSSGEIFKIPVAAGDVVVAGSDGLYDNLYGKEVAAIVGDAVREGLNPDETASKIAGFARIRALDKKHQTPFAVAAQQAGYTYYGGKLDDLTVVVSFVSS